MGSKDFVENGVLVVRGVSCIRDDENCKVVWKWECDGSGQMLDRDILGRMLFLKLKVLERVVVGYVE